MKLICQDFELSGVRFVCCEDCHQSFDHLVPTTFSPKSAHPLARVTAEICCGAKATIPDHPLEARHLAASLARDQRHRERKAEKALLDRLSKQYCEDCGEKTQTLMFSRVLCSPCWIIDRIDRSSPSLSALDAIMEKYGIESQIKKEAQMRLEEQEARRRKNGWSPPKQEDPQPSEDPLDPWPATTVHKGRGKGIFEAFRLLFKK